MKVCLIGSTRFMQKYQETNEKLTKGGHVVYSVCMASTGKPEERESLTPHEKETLDLVHLLKIQNSEVVCLITDSSAYVGESTKREIKWCLLTGKQILLPEHFHTLDQNLVAVEAAIKKALAEVSPIDMNTKIDVSKVKI